MINGFPIIDRFRGEDEYKQLCELAKTDNHGVFAPTHPVRKNGELVGYFSIAPQGVPIVFAWLSTEHILPRESFALINTVENHVALAGNVAMCLPVPKTSPFYGVMESMGYVPAGEYTFFVKKL
jgi:hypothetical protein